MRFDSPFWCVPATGVLLLFVSTPLFRAADSPPETRQKRNVSLDGLRGILALAVAFHHIVIYHTFLAFDTAPEAWAAPQSHFYAELGLLAVSLFFMITGYLFWYQISSSVRTIDWPSFYVGRIFRIGPVYVMCMVFALILDHSGLLRTVPSPVSRQISSVALLGLSVYPDPSKSLAGVSWSIQWEWLFYLALPFLAPISKLSRASVLAALCVVTGCLFYRHYYQGLIARPGSVLVCFFALAVVAATMRQRAPNLRLPDWMSSVAVLIMLACAASFTSIFLAVPVLLIATSFYLLASGCTLFGLLTSRPVLRLGNVSYGFYLCQGLAFCAVLRPNALRSNLLSSSAVYWIVAFGGLMVLAVFATLTHVLIEKPGIKMGKLLRVSLSNLQAGRSIRPASK